MVIISNRPREQFYNRNQQPETAGKKMHLVFSKSEVIFSIFPAENDFVNALILFIRVRGIQQWKGDQK
jgi:hypothetical protein